MNMNAMKSIVLKVGVGVGAGMVLAALATAHAAEIRVISSVGVKAALEQLKPEFERITSHKLTLLLGSAVPLKRQIDAGETFDVAILTPSMIDELVKVGKVAAGSKTDVAKVGMGVTGRVGAAQPDISTTEAFKSALLDARLITHSKEGLSGTYTASMIERLGIAAQMKPKTVLETRSGHTPVAVVEGKADLGLCLISEILPVAGATFIGPFPPELQTYVMFTAGISATASDAQAAKAFVQFFSVPLALPILKSTGMEPG